jgi:hypothetical protein
MYNYPIGGNSVLGKRTLPPANNDSLEQQVQEINNQAGDDYQHPDDLS